VDAKKMAFAILVAGAAVAAAVAAAAHSKAILDQEQHPYPPATLALRQSAIVEGLEVRIDDADVLESVASVDTRGYERMVEAPDRRFLRLTVFVRNTSTKPVRISRVIDRLHQVEVSTGQTKSSKVVWLRGYDALPGDALAPGKEAGGKVALDVSAFALAFPFLVELGPGEARWGVDVIDRNATTRDLM
jgi:hypothetical protein